MRKEGTHFSMSYCLSWSKNDKYVLFLLFPWYFLDAKQVKIKISHRSVLEIFGWEFKILTNLKGLNIANFASFSKDSRKLILSSFILKIWKTPRKSKENGQKVNKIAKISSREKITSRKLVPAKINPLKVL